jgi:hypothetical protein
VDVQRVVSAPAGPDEPEPVPPAGRDRWLRELPSIALALLACAQIGLAFGADLSPWKGGGFGMFATNDHGSFRSVRVFAVGPGSEQRMAVPSDRLQDLFRVRELPNDSALRAFAGSLAGAAPDAAAIRVEVWRARFDADLRATYERLASATWEAP